LTRALCAALQLEALYSLLDDDGSGSLTVHEMIDLFVRPAHTPPQLPSAYTPRLFGLAATCGQLHLTLFLRPHRTVSTTTPSSSTTATATPRLTTGEHICRMQHKEALRAAYWLFLRICSDAARGCPGRLGDGYCDDGTDAEDGGLDCALDAPT